MAASTTTTATIPSPTSAGGRLAYLDTLIKDAHLVGRSQSPQSIHSTMSSSTFSSEPRALHSPTLLTPTYEEEDNDGRVSPRSLKLHFSPRRNFRSLINRRTFPDVQEMVDVEPPSRSCSSSGSLPQEQRPATRHADRKSPLPRLQTSFSTPKLRAEAQMYATRPLPPIPSLRVEELRCQPCYYFAARNCNGYVFGGSHGDACEHCLAAGFFGAS